MNGFLTGGTGFIGSHMAMELVKHGYHAPIPPALIVSSTRLLSHISKIVLPREPAAPLPQILTQQVLRKLRYLHPLRPAAG